MRAPGAHGYQRQEKLVTESGVSDDEMNQFAVVKKVSLLHSNMALVRNMFVPLHIISYLNNTERVLNRPLRSVKEILRDSEDIHSDTLVSL